MSDLFKPFSRFPFCFLSSLFACSLCLSFVLGVGRTSMAGFFLPSWNDSSAALFICFCSLFSDIVLELYSKLEMVS